jgi:alpha-L-fucosidase
MKTTPQFLVLTLAFVSLVMTARAADAITEREKTLRFPDRVIRNDSYYVEREPDADYRHAPAAAYDAFRAMKYGVRIHWGLYSLLPVSHESWTFLELSDADRQKYLDSYKQWNPQGFNAEEWMQFFERAGFRDFAITTKHHEGFSLFDTKTRVVRRADFAHGPAIVPTNVAFSVMETPFRRDIIKELTDAGHAHGLKIDLYFSHTDWFDADFRPYGTAPLQVTGPQSAGSQGVASLERRQGRPAVLFPPVTAEERAQMMARHRAQLLELARNYGNVDMMCLDIFLGPTEWPEMKETIKEIRRLQPNVMLRNRGIGNYGDYYTPERVVPGEIAGNPMPWMVIYPLGTNFSYDGEAKNYKGAKWVVDNLVDCVSKGGNFMVGIGPDANGKFHPTAIAQLEEVGTWLKTNGEGIFNTHLRGADTWKDGDDVRLSDSDDGRHVYAFLLKRPAGPVTLHSVHVEAGAKITLLGHSEPLKWHAADGGIVVDFPASAPQSFAYALKIESRH